jgi:hypothetical protein
MPGSVNTDFGGDSVSDEKSWQLQPADVAQVSDGSLWLSGDELFQVESNFVLPNHQRNRELNFVGMISVTHASSRSASNHAPALGSITNTVGEIGNGLAVLLGVAATIRTLMQTILPRKSWR